MTLDADFWARFNATKMPGEHEHELEGGGRVYCNLPTVGECAERWHLTPSLAPSCPPWDECDDCYRTDGTHDPEVEH